MTFKIGMIYEELTLQMHNDYNNSIGATIHCNKTPERFFRINCIFWVIFIMFHT